MPQIFLSYRRSDSEYIAPMLSEKLQQHFGADSVFFDIGSIPLGVDFREYIEKNVAGCDVLIAIIGDQWLGAVDGRGKRRLDDPSDFVRIEIESALKRSIPVIPVLVDKVEMPSADDLPPSIKSLVYRNATELRAGRDLHSHMELLIQGLKSLLGVKDVTEKAPVHASKQMKVWDGAPSDLLEEIKKNLEGFTDKRLFVGTIPPKKLNNAIATYATDVPPEDVVLLYDDTVFGSAKDGFLLTAKAVHWRNSDGDPDRLRYEEIRKVDFLKYTVSAGIVLNEKEINVTSADEAEKLAEAVGKVIRGLTKG